MNEQKSWFQRAIESVRQFFCIHDDILSFDENRVQLQCVKCLRLTKGWTVDRKAVQRCA